MGGTQDGGREVTGYREQGLVSFKNLWLQLKKGYTWTPRSGPCWGPPSTEEGEHQEAGAGVQRRGSGSGSAREAELAMWEGRPGGQ